MDYREKLQIFHDPHNKRWPRIKNTVILLLSLLFFLIIAFIVSIYLTPALNQLPLSPVGRLKTIHYPIAGKTHNHSTRRNEPKLFFHQWQSSVKGIISKLTGNNTKKNGQPVTIAFLVNDDDASFRSLVNNLRHIDVIIGEYLHLTSSDGEFVEDNLKKQYSANAYIRLHKPQTKVIPLINNVMHGDWQSKMVGDLMTSPEKQNKFIASLLAYVTQHNYAGINIDFEEIPVLSQKNFSDFIKKLSDIFHKNALTVSLDIPNNTKNTAFNARELSQWVDFIIVMLYDEHEDKSRAGPVSSLGWFIKALGHSLDEIPSNKLVIGLGNYGYDWVNNTTKAVEITFQDIMNISKLADASIRFDHSLLDPSLNYLENDTIPHTIWFNDAATVFNQVSISQSLKPYGYAIWRLGSEDPSMWDFLGHTVGLNDVAKLETIEPGYSLYYQGKGEIIDVDKLPKQGSRKIIYDKKRNLIVKEQYLNPPLSYILNRYGGEDPKKIALTFDDGPDPVYTEKILDILKANKTPATFFIIGENAMLYPNILKRELAEGHDIGNHTFTHPNISEISYRHLIAEVSFTQRLFETLLGRGSHLFRPPYAEDSEPSSPSEVNAISELTNREYLIVGMKIDPSDWLQPGVDVIVQNILKSLKNKEGNIILLHDSGGKREQTIMALPKIISEIKARGYQFVTVSELLGLPQSQVMPLADKNVWESLVDHITFNIMSWGSKTVTTLFFICIMLGVIRVLALCVLAIYQKVSHTHRRRKLVARDNDSVVVVVPAYNEGKVIVRTIDRLLEIDHPSQYKILVVDDGSTDNTLQLLEENYKNNPIVTIISQENAGKASALNNAINNSDADIIVTLDADTLFSKKTIMELIVYFEDLKVGAVAGNIKVGNKINVLTRMQSIEYITSQNLERRAFQILNAITIIPGSVGAWRRQALIDAGGFTRDTLAEDADLTLKIRKLGYTIDFAEKATAFTEAPDTVKVFLQQRYRWMFGTFQVAFKHINVLFRPQYGYLGFVALPSIFLYQLIFPFIAPLMDLLLLLAITSSLFDRIYHPLSYDDATLVLSVTFYLLFTLVDFLTALICFLLESKESKKSLVLLIPQRFFYRQLIYYVALKTIVSSLRGGAVGWNKAIRKATVNVQQQ